MTKTKVVLTKDLELDRKAGIAAAGTEAVIVDQLAPDCFILEVAIPDPTVVGDFRYVTLEAEASDFRAAHCEALDAALAALKQLMASTPALAERAQREMEKLTAAAGRAAGWVDEVRLPEWPEPPSVRRPEWTAPPPEKAIAANTQYALAA